MPCIQRIHPPRAEKIQHQPRRILDAPAPLRLWHLTSLDAPTVAVVWSLAFAWDARISLPVWVPTLLALTAWAVYIGDRLLDARSTLRTVHHHRLRLRHRFHWRHRRFFIPVAVAAACAAAFIVFSCMPVAARGRNSVLAAAAFVYFTRVHSTREQTLLPSPLRSPFFSILISKEMLVGVLFTAACALPALTRATFQPNSPLWIMIVPTVFFALLAWLNCHAIENWESNSHSAIWFPALALSVAGLLASIILLASHPRSAALLIAGAASALLLALLDRFRTCLTPLALRAAADLVLLTPISLLFIAR
jgi:hypothetical protein